MRRAVLIYNPLAGSQRAGLHQRVAARLADAGFEVSPRPTEAAGHASELAREAAGSGVEVAFAMGGDGTLRETAAGLLGTETALGPVPAGTANVLAHALGVPRKPLAAAAALVDSRVREIDVGTLSIGDGPVEPFLMMVSTGLDAAVMRRQSPVLKRLVGRAAFAASGLRQWWGYPYPEIVVHAAGGARRSGFAAVCNIPFYGGRFRLAPQADLSDGQLDLVLFHGRGRWVTLGFARDLVLGRHLGRRDVEARSVEAAELELPEGVYLQVDGDVRTPAATVRVGLAPHRLRVLCPA